MATLVKVTVFILLFAVFIIWLMKLIVSRELNYLYYIIICLALVAAINAPWFIYKQQNFQAAFSINLYETNKQNIVTSQGWAYIGRFNWQAFSVYPFWYSYPHSFWTILIADTFSDYYNLFDNFQRLDTLPDNQKIIVGNGRLATLAKYHTMLWTNRLGLLMIVIWVSGLCGLIISRLWQKKIDWYELLILLAIAGGLAALLYNNLRLPYLERGVLKAQFIFYAFPLLSLLPNQWW